MKKLSQRIPFALISFLVTTSACAASVELPMRGPIPFANYDQDGSGTISEQEFTQVRNERMAAKAAQGRRMKGAGNAPAFASFDVNSDGQLTQQELTAGQQRQMQNRSGNRDKTANMGQGRGKGAGQGKGGNMPSFSYFDLNDDGVILEQELYKARAKRITKRAEQGYPMRNVANAPSFTDIDINSNGEISLEEFTKHQVTHRQRLMKK